MALNGIDLTKEAPSINGSSGSNGTNGLSRTNDSNGSHGYRTKEVSFPSPMPIAVVGMACRFAGDATSPERLWDLCASGRDAWSRIPESRFDVKSLYDRNKERPGRVWMQNSNIEKSTHGKEYTDSNMVCVRTMQPEDTFCRKMWRCLTPPFSASRLTWRV